MALTLSAQGFGPDQAIPVQFTCDGAGVSPQLSWHGEPEGTRSFALILDDPDAPKGTFTHWVLFNIPGTIHSIAEGQRTVEQLDIGAMQGQNSLQKLGYTPPCPPAGDKPHHYRFTLYALEADALNLAPGCTKDQLVQAIQGNILGEAQLTATCQRQQQPAGSR